MYELLIEKIREVQNFNNETTPLHAPVFAGKEKEYVLDAIESTYVSSVGEYVNRFEQMLCEITGAARAIACCNGTCALELALRLVGVSGGDAVITQSLSFVATANAIAHIGADPIFVDIEEESLGLSPDALEEFLKKECVKGDKGCIVKKTDQKLAACVPMHTFGHPADMGRINAVCDAWGIPVVEDAAEAIGSYYNGIHCGTLGKVGVLSFNGNKTVTTGGGGAILTNDPELGQKAKHLTTAAKLPHPYLYRHDQTGWNYRLPNLNAALGCAQLEQLDHFLEIKRKRAEIYAELFSDSDWRFIPEPSGTRSNYWLCAALTNNRAERDRFLEETNASGLGTRPVWDPLHTLPMYKDCLRGNLDKAVEIASRLVNLPSGVENGF